MSDQTKTAKSPHDMTIQELQNEIGKLQTILHFKVCSDPSQGIGLIAEQQCQWRGPAIWNIT